MPSSHSTAASPTELRCVPGVVNINCDLPIENENICNSAIEQPKFKEVGTQCCINPRFVIHKSAQTQTLIVVVKDGECQHDPQPQPLKTLYEECYSDSDSEDEPIVLDKSEDYIASDDSEASCSTEYEDDLPNITMSKERKFIVFESQLDVLLRQCQICGGIVEDSCMVKSCSGSMLTVSATCINGHDIKWDSQPLINRLPAGNLLVSAAILFSGNTFQRVCQIASFLNLQFFSPNTYYDIQRYYLFPLVNQTWEKEKRSILGSYKDEQSMTIGGDGRCDSPGHNAKFCTYTMMNEDGKILTFELVQVTEATSSNAMEKLGFERCLQELRDNDLDINIIVTDRHTSISSSMDKNHEDISHQFDVWHMAKWVRKKLKKKSKEKAYSELTPWIQSLTNHLWWCSATCEGNVEILREKWTSIVHHVSNKHRWAGNKHFRRCSHARLPQNKQRQTKWLKAGSAAHVALEDIVYNSKFLKDLSKLTEFCHTGELESYHSMLLKYCPKREHFPYNGMLVRSQLAAIDHNAHSERPQAKTKTGEPRYKLSHPKTQKKWVVKPIKEKKSYQHVGVMMEDLVNEVKEGTFDDEESPTKDIPRNITGSLPPNKVELIQKHKSRFT